MNEEVTPDPTYADSATFFREKMGSQVDAIVLSVNGKEVAGLLVIDSDINGLRVDPELRKMGIATALINTAKQRHAALTLVCEPSLVPFYQRHGFAVTGPHQIGHHMGWVRCWTCGGTGTVNTFDEPVTESNALEWQPGPCPDCNQPT